MESGRNKFDLGFQKCLIYTFLCSVLFLCICWEEAPQSQPKQVQRSQSSPGISPSKTLLCTIQLPIQTQLLFAKTADITQCHHLMHWGGHREECPEDPSGAPENPITSFPSWLMAVPLYLPLTYIFPPLYLVALLFFVCVFFSPPQCTFFYKKLIYIINCG